MCRPYDISDLDFVGMQQVRRWAARDVKVGGRPAVVLNHRKPIAVLVPYEWFVAAQSTLRELNKAADAVDPHAPVSGNPSTRDKE